MAFASQKVLWSVPQTVLYIGLTVSCSFLGKWLLLQKRFCGGFRQLFFAFVSQIGCCFIKVLWRVPPTVLYSLLLGSKLRELLTWSAENDPSCRCCWGILWAYKGFGAELLSDSLWFSGADPSWAAKRFCGRFHQGFH